MNSQDCVFCKIINKDITAEIVYESEKIIVVKDLHPKAPIHNLIIPKKHISSIFAVTDKDADLAYDLFKTVRYLAQKLPDPKACNIISNNGAAAGQSVMHIHLHFLSGRNLYQGNFSL